MASIIVVPVNDGSQIIPVISGWPGKKGDPGSPGEGYADRVSMAARASPSLYDDVYLTETGREGKFVVDDASLWTDAIAADTEQGIFVPATTDVTKVYRRIVDGPVVVRWFGTAGDGVTDDSAAFVAAIAHLKSIAHANTEIYYEGSPRLLIPAGHYYLGTTTLDLTHTFILEGESSLGAGMATRLEWATGTTGIRIQAYNTSGGASTTTPGFNSGSYTKIRNLSLTGPLFNINDFTGHTEGEYHGIHARSNVIIEDVRIDGFEGDGLHVLTSVGLGGADEGNSNCSFVNRLVVTNVRNGVYLDGADANVWTLIGVVGLYCRQHTVWDSSFLGNTHIGHHSSNAGLIKGVSPCVVSYSGNRYCVKQGQTVGASTNAPSGTTADNAYWLYISAGAADASLNIPTWANPTTVREGGGYRSDNINARNTFIGCYQEGGEGFSQFVSPTVLIGGLLSASTTGNVYTGSTLIAPLGVALGQTRIADTATPILSIHNFNALSGGLYAGFEMEQGYETDGTTPLNLAAIKARGSTADPATTEAVIEFQTRTVGGTGGMTTRFVLDGSNLSVRPDVDNIPDLGMGPFRWKTIYGYTGDFTTAVKIAGLQVMGPRITGWAAATNTKSKATFDTTTVTLPDLAARVAQLIDDLMTHGVIGT